MCTGKRVSGSLFSSPGSFATTLRSPSRQSRERIGLLYGIMWTVQTGLTYAGRGEGRSAGGRACGNQFFQGSGAGLRRSPRFAPSLGLFGKKRGGAVRADLYLDLGAQCVLTPVPPGDFHNVRSWVSSRNSYKVEGGEKRTHPLARRDLGDFEFPLPPLFRRALLLLSSPFDKWWGWERWEPGADMRLAQGRGSSLETGFRPPRTLS